MRIQFDLFSGFDSSELRRGEPWGARCRLEERESLGAGAGFGFAENQTQAVGDQVFELCSVARRGCFGLTEQIIGNFHGGLHGT